MKNLLFIALIAAFFAGCSGKSTSADKASAAVVANKTVTLSIEGMSCTDCENTIQQSVTKIAGVTQIKASHLDSTAVVSFDTTKTNLAAIGNAINDAGYVYKGLKSNSKPAGTN